MRETSRAMATARTIATCAALLALLFLAAGTPPLATAAATPRASGGSAAVRLRQRGQPGVVLALSDLKQQIERQRGKVVLLHLWAMWCRPCMEELPMIANMATSMRPQGVEVLSVSLDNVTPQSAKRVGEIIDGPGRGALTRAMVRLDDPDAFVNAVNASWDGTIPALFGYDRNGVLSGALLGEVSRQEIQSMLDDLVKGSRSEGRKGGGSGQPAR